MATAASAGLPDCNIQSNGKLAKPFTMVAMPNSLRRPTRSDQAEASGTVKINTIAAAVTELSTKVRDSPTIVVRYDSIYSVNTVNTPPSPIRASHPSTTFHQ